MIKNTLFLVLLTVINLSFGQSLNLNFLFKPGITVGADYTAPSTFNDTSSFQLTKYSAQVLIPLKTKLGVSLKKLDLKASQIFLTFNTSMRQSNFSQSSFDNQNIYTFSPGITAVSASARNGLWLYSGNIFMSESSSTITDSPSLNAIGYIAKIKLKSLKFIYFYGVAGVYNFGKLTGAPILGFTAKLNKKFRLTLVLPVQYKLAYKVKKGTTIELGSTLSGFNSVFRDQNNINLNYRQLKNHLIFNTKITSKIKLSIEGGISTFRRITYFEKTKRKYYNDLTPALYTSFSINYSFGQSLFDMKIKGFD